jgi:putative ABC transport system permease protein
MSYSISKKIWRDLAERKGRTLLTVLGLVVGLWGVGSVSVAWWVLGTDMSANFLSTNPPAITMTVAGETAVDVAAIGKLDGIRQIENRPQINGRIEITPNSWRPLLLWVVDDFNAMTVAKAFPESGVLPPPTGSFVMERDGLLLGNFLRARAQSGTSGHGAQSAQPSAPLTGLEDSPIAITLAGGKAITAQLSGTVFDPAQAPSRMEQVYYGYISLDTALLWTDGVFDQRLLVTTDATHQQATIVASADRLTARLQQLGYQVLDTRYPSATEHVHQFQMNSILFLLSGLGVLSLLMSVVLVLNLVNGILTSQVRQIGIIKAIGGSASQVALIYLGAMLLLGLMASLVALPLALKTGYWIAGGLSAFLNFEVLTTSLPMVFGLTFFILGSLFPVLAALYPVRRWSRLPVSDALQHCGASLPEEGRSRLNTIKLPLPINIRMGLRNAFRKPGRTLLTATTLALGVVIFMAAMNMRSSLLYTADTEESLKGFDVIVAFEEPIHPESVAFMGMFDLVERAETWRVQSAMVIDEEHLQTNPLPLYLVPPDSQVLRPAILEGQWLNAGRSEGVVINQRLQNDHPQLGVGSTLPVQVGEEQLRLPVIGIMKEFGGPAIYMAEAAYRTLLPATDQLITTGFVALKEPNEQNLAELIRTLESHFKIAGVNVRAIRSAKVASRVIRGHLDVIVATLLVVAVFMLLVSSLGMASAISTNIVERTRELGILRAIGGKPGAIRSILCSESLVIALLGWLTALLLAQPVSRFLSDYFGTALVEYPFDYKGSIEGALLSLVLIVVLAGLATLAPARLAARQSVKEAIAYE